MLLSGGYANHAAMIIADESNSLMKYVIDCPSDANYLNGMGGVRKMELNEWLGRALGQGYDVVWLPLDKNLRTFGDLDQGALE